VDQDHVLDRLGSRRGGSRKKRNHCGDGGDGFIWHRTLLETFNLLVE